MKILKFLLICIIIAFSQSSFAQEQVEESVVEEKPLKFEVGFDASPILLDGSLFMPGLLFRYHLGNSAYRIRLNIDKSLTKFNYSGDTRNEYNSYGYIFRFGKEWRKNVRKSQFYFGSDAFLQTNRSRHKEFVRRENTDDLYLEEERETKSAGFGLMPFLGFDFAFSKQIHFGLEATSEFAYNTDKRETVDYNEDGTEDGRTGGQEKTFNMALLSNYALILSYRF